MPAITTENRDAWQTLADECGKHRPSVGRRVRVTGGRKHLGKEGLVTWHGVNKYASTRYSTEAQLHLRDLMGQHGFRVRIQTDEGEAFFVDADKVEVVS